MREDFKEVQPGLWERTYGEARAFVRRNEELPPAAVDPYEVDNDPYHGGYTVGASLARKDGLTLLVQPKTATALATAFVEAEKAGIRLSRLSSWIDNAKPEVNWQARALAAEASLAENEKALQEIWDATGDKPSKT